MGRAFAVLTMLLPAAALALQPALPPVARAQIPPAHQREADDRADAEREMLERAHAERMQRITPERSSNAGYPAEPGREGAIAESAMAAEVERRVEAAERQAELDHLSELIRRRTAARGHWLPESPAADDGVPADPAAAPVPPAATAQGPVRATVLLTLRPGTTGIRRLARTADPILCTTEVCWVSRGPDRDARMLPRRVALGALNTLGGRAGACNDSTGCVFRNVGLSGEALLQPVDLRIVRHDRREARTAHVDRTCRAERGALMCEGIQAGPDYQLLVVPEDVAQKAGARVLSSAVRGGRP